MFSQPNLLGVEQHREAPHAVASFSLFKLHGPAQVFVSDGQCGTERRVLACQLCEPCVGSFELRGGEGACYEQNTPSVILIAHTEL